MPSLEHEDIIDDVRFASSFFLAECASLLDCDSWEIGATIADAFAFTAIFGLRDDSGRRGLAADFHMMLEDDAGPVMVEVGNMKDGKWNHLEWEDGLPVRVLRIGFDRSVSLIRPRRTQLETAYVKWVDLSLQGIEPMIEVKKHAP